MLSIELNLKSINELIKIEEESRAELFALRFQASIGNLDKPHRIKELKIIIARILTIFSEKEKSTGKKINRNIKVDLSKTFKTIEKDTKKLIKKRKEMAEKMMKEQQEKSNVNNSFFDESLFDKGNEISNDLISNENLNILPDITSNNNINKSKTITANSKSKSEKILTSEVSKKKNSEILKKEVKIDSKKQDTKIKKITVNSKSKSEKILTSEAFKKKNSEILKKEVKIDSKKQDTKIKKITVNSKSKSEKILTSEVSKKENSKLVKDETNKNKIDVKNEKIKKKGNVLMEKHVELSIELSNLLSFEVIDKLNKFKETDKKFEHLNILKLKECYSKILISMDSDVKLKENEVSKKLLINFSKNELKELIEIIKNNNIN